MEKEFLDSETGINMDCLKYCQEQLQKEIYVQLEEERKINKELDSRMIYQEKGFIGGLGFGEGCLNFPNMSLERSNELNELIEKFMKIYDIIELTERLNKKVSSFNGKE